MKLVDVKYKKPFILEQRNFPGIRWAFTAELDIVFPHGHNFFGGVLQYTENVGWQARHYSNTGWAEPAETREGAIENLMPLAYAVIEKFQKELRDRDAEVARRYALADELAALFLANTHSAWGLHLGVGTNAGNHDKPPIFTVTLKGLSEVQVRLLADQLAK